MRKAKWCNVVKCDCSQDITEINARRGTAFFIPGQHGVRVRAAQQGDIATGMALSFPNAEKINFQRKPEVAV